MALFHSQAIAELGFICVFIDGRGTGDRSRDFRLRSQKNLKDGAGGPDHICLMKQMGETYLAMDLSRVGVWGHSAGGYDSARAIFDNADWYKVAVSSAGCHDNRMDKASWNEQWMGKIGPHYEENSNCETQQCLCGALFCRILDKLCIDHIVGGSDTAAHKLKGKLLLAVTHKRSAVACGLWAPKLFLADYLWINPEVECLGYLLTDSCVKTARGGR